MRSASWLGFLPAVLTAASLAAATSPARPPVLPFLEDDYARALAEAKAKHVPLFVEAWAPW